MKKFLFLIIAIIISASVYSDTIPGGDVSGTWTLANSPYYITGDITIPNGETLIIEAGVRVEWQDHYTMWVQGRILAQGNMLQSITFTASDPVIGFGGIRFEGTPPGNDTSEFNYCTFEHGKVYGATPDNAGGAIAVLLFDKIIIDHCLFKYNQALDESVDNPVGGAIALSLSSPIIRNSTFTNNESSGGGAIYCDQGEPVIYNNEFYNNTAYYFGASWGQGYGGAIICYNKGNPSIGYNVISGNVAEGGGGGIALVDSCCPMIDHNVIEGNTSAWWGGGIEIQTGCYPVIMNNTIVNNSSDKGGGIDIYETSTPEIHNSIIWGNVAFHTGSQVHIMENDNTPDFLYCDVQYGLDSIGGYPVTGKWQGCIQEYPEFIDPSLNDFHLDEGSPCIDTGDPAMLDPDSTRCDMGAFYHDQLTGLPENDMTIAQINLHCYPNPVKEFSVVSYQLPVSGTVNLAIYDLSGKLINILAEEYQRQGTKQTRPNLGYLPPGVYFISLQIDKYVFTKKVIKQ